jgi:HAMP domain-containing protein
MKRTALFILFWMIWWSGHAQSIRTVYHNVNNGTPSSSVNTPGTILYPTGYNAYDYKTPIVFVHGFTGKLTGAYEANIDIVRSYGFNAAFVQLDPMGTTEDNGMLLKRMIDRITAHFGSATVSIVAHSKGGMDTERALYGHNPYDYSIPSFGYEKVDGVYTFGSPLRGSRLADVGSSLSWTGIAWIAMWYTNGFSMTSANVQAFRNWAKSWRINSNGTFRNYYNPNGASYSRINLIEDNTTRWWAHQSDDPCYADRWYFCYGGNVFHHTVGAYLDAYWEWDWFNSGWRNWHPENDGFIAVYRAQRSMISNNTPALTPGAGDSNYITMNDADHISLWDPGEGHFRDEVAPYVHYGLYDHMQYRPARQTNEKKNITDNGADVISDPVYLSNGYVYVARNGQASVIVENDQAEYQWMVFSDEPVDQIILSGSGVSYTLNAEETYFDALANAHISIFSQGDLEKGVYNFSVTNGRDAVVFANNLNPLYGFAVKWNMNDSEGYKGNPVEIKVAGIDKENLDDMAIVAELTRISHDNKPLDAGRLKKIDLAATLVDAGKGLFVLQLPDLLPGEQYAVKVNALLQSGNQYLHRNAITTFYVHEDLPMKDVSVAKNELHAPSTGNLIIYPNPADDIATLDLPFEGNKTVMIKDISGKTLMEFHTEKNALQISVNDLKQGTYIIQVEIGEKVLTDKLIVE